MRISTLIVSLLMFCTSGVLARDGVERLDNDLRYLVGRYADHGEFSVAVADHQGLRAAVNADTNFPLASVFKLPLLLAVLEDQHQGTFPKPNEVLILSNSDLCIGSGSLARRGIGAAVTVDEACRLMMSVSDNTATDVLMRRYGPGRLDPQLQSWGVQNSEILLTNRQAWFLSLGEVPGWGKTTPEQRVDLWRRLGRQDRLGLAQKIEESNKGVSLAAFQAIEDRSASIQSRAQDRMLAAALDNTMRADHLALLLVKLDRGEILSPQGRQAALNYLAGQRYHSRLPKGLSSSSKIYHKTGTLEGVINDAGLIYPKGQTQGVAVVFLSKNVKTGSEGRADSLAAEVAKLVEKAY